MDRFKNDFNIQRPSRNQSFAEKVKAGIYNEYIGQYKFELRPELVVTIKRVGDRLMSESGDQVNELFAREGSEHELSTKEFDGTGKFVRNKRGRISHVIYYEVGREMGRAKKIC
jgi:hypothetical protein